MKNRVFILSFLISMISVNFVFAQTSTKKLSYQAVVRNAANELVVNQNLAVEITVLDAENAPQYKETHPSVPTNQNGLLWLWVGEGNPTLGTMEDVVWKDAVIRSVFTLPDGSTVTQNTPVTAMPYAYFADEVDTIFLQNYLDTHDVVPDNYVTHPQLNDTLDHYYTKGNVDNKLNDYEKKSELCGDVKECIKDTLGKYTTSNQIDTLLGAYYDTTHTKSVISDTATALRAMMGDAAYNSKITLKKNNVELDSFRLNQQTDKAINIPVPTTVAELSDAGNYTTNAQLNDTLSHYYTDKKINDTLSHYLTQEVQVLSVSNDTLYLTGGSWVKLPKGFSGDYNDLTNRPDLSVYATNVHLDDTLSYYFDTTQVKTAIHDTAVAIRAAIPAQVNADWNATSGKAEILNKPTIPTTVAELSDAANYTTNAHLNDTLSHYYDTTQVKTAIHDTANAIRAAIPAQVNADWNATGGPAEILNKPDLSVYATNAHLNDTLNSFATKDTLSAYATKDTLKNFLTISGLCDSLVKCGVIKDMRDSIRDNAAAIQINATAIQTNATNIGLNKQAIIDSSAHIRNDIKNGQITIAVNRSTATTETTVTNPTFGVNQGTDQTVTINIPQETTVNNGQLTIVAAGDTTRFTANQATNDTVRLNKFATKEALKNFLTINGLCDSIVKCEVVKNMRDSLGNAFDTLSHYTTSSQIDTLLRAYYDTTHTKSVISDTATALRAMMGDAAYNAKITLKKNNVELDSFRLNQQTDKAINIPVPTTVAELSDAGNYVTKTKLNDTLGAYYDTANVKQMLKPYLKANELCDSIVKCDVIKDMRDSLDNAFDTLSYYYTSKKINDTLKHYFDSTQVKDAIHDSIGNGKITIQKNGATITDGSFYLNQKTDQTINITVPTQTSELTNNSNLAYTTGNTFSGTHDFTATTITVPSNEDAIKRPVPTTTPATECTNMNAVNVCDLLAVFDSLTKRIDALQQELDELKNFTLPVFNSLTFTDITSTTMKVKAQFTSQITPIISYKFCYSTNSDMSSPTCVDTTASEITLKGLNPFQRYYITVTASNIAGSTTGSGNERTYADKPEASTIETTPSPSGFEITVSNLHFNGPSEGTIQVFYKQGTDCAEDEEGFTAVSNPIEMVNGSTYYRRVTNLEAETPYCVLVKLSNEDSTKVYSLNVVSGAALSLSIEIDTISTISICEDDTVVITFTAKLNYSEYKNDYNYQFVYSTSQSTQRVKYISRTDSSFKMAFFTQPNRTTYQCTITANAVHKTYGSEDNLRADSVITVNKITHPTFTICNDRQIINFTRMDEGVTSVAWGDGATDNNPSVASSHLYDAPGFYNLEVSRGSCTTTKRISVNQNLTPCIVSTPHIDNSEYTPETGGLEVAVDDTVYSVKDQDGHSYQVTQIGTQCWMKSNLRTTTLSDGTNLSYGTDESNGNLTLDAAVKYYYKPTAAHTNTNYNFDYSRYNEERDGLYYNWTAAMNGASSSNSVPSNVQGICPKGWHVPSRAEWDILIGYAETTYGTSTGYANQLSGGCEWDPINELVNSEGNPGYYANANRNITGFSALPVGCIDYPSTFINNITSDARATFWTTETGGTFNRPYVKIFYNIHNYVGEESSATAKMAMSVRCLRDADGPVTPTTSCSVTNVGTNEEAGENNTITAVRDVQNHKYGVVEIGGQCWMKENLRTTKYNDGSDVTYYDYSESNIPLERRGYLYDWNVTMNQSGSHDICPNGWHVPSLDEWESLNVSEYQCDGNIARAMAANTDWYVSTTQCQECEVCYDLNNNNSSGFSAIPAGFHEQSGFDEAGSSANFWTSSINNSNNEPRYVIINIWSGYRNTSDPATNGYSVRCVRDGEASVTTSSAVNISTTGAWLRGNVVARGNTIVEKGFYWKATEDGTYVKVTSTGGTLTSRLSGLTANTSYTYYAFATTADGTVNGEEVVFTTSEEPSVSNCGTVTDVDGNTYNTVMIGSQCWMKENLRTKGTLSSFENVTNPSVTPFYYQPTTSDFAEYTVPTYGLYYNRSAALNNYDGTGIENPSNNIQGICPTGWHIPSKSEWETLNVATDNSPCKLAGSSDWSGNDWGDDDVSPGNYGYPYRNQTGFTALPSGRLDVSSGTMDNSTYPPHAHALFWSSSFDNNATYYLRLWYYDVPFYFETCGNDYAFPVRCVKD